MKSNNFLFRTLFGYSEKRIIGRKRLLTTYVSLFLICALLATSTFSWFYVNNTAAVDTNLFTMSSSTGLSINEGESITNKIILDDFKLSEASSVDGRNMFFPTLGTFNSNLISDMVFREGNAGDKNIHYASKNITIVGVTDPTNIYVKDYKLSVKGNYNGEAFEEIFDGTTQVKDTNNDGIDDYQVKHEKCPIRIAFIKDSQDKPRVFDPTAIVQQHVDKYKAVDRIDSNGEAITKDTDDESFSDYIFSFDGEPLFQISQSDSIDLTMVVWLEGTGENCDRYADATLSVTVELESNWSNMVPVKFVDKTSNDDNNSKNTVDSWIGGGNCIVTMAYDDADGATKTVVMDKVKDASPPTWIAMLPQDITTNISFYRFSLDDETIYNSWHTEVGVNDQLSPTAEGWLNNVFKTPLEEDRILSNGTPSLTYTARCGNGFGEVSETDSQKDMKRLSPCIGFWDETVAGKGLTGGGGTGGGTGGGGGSVGSKVQIGVNLEIPSNKNWISNNLRNGFTIHVELDNGELLKMNVNGSYNYCTYSGEIEVGRTIKNIDLMNTSGAVTNRLNLVSPQPIAVNYNYNYKVNNEDKIERI